MNFNEYQKLSRKTAIYPNKGNNIVYPTLGLVGEAGEVAEKVKKLIRDEDNKLTEERRGALILEIGDVLWYISALCNELNVRMEFVAQKNIEKLSKRQNKNQLHGDGDNR